MSSPSGDKTITFDSTSSKYHVQVPQVMEEAIETTVTDKSNVTDEWVKEILSIYAGESTVVGLDIEWRPRVKSWMSNKSATLQLCVDKKCLIVQLFYIDEIPKSLKNFLADPNFTFVGIEVAGDIEKLRNEYGLDCAKSEVIRDAAKRKWPSKFRRPGLKDLAWELVELDMKKPKEISMSNWENKVLTENQVEYACIDAYASYRIGHKLLQEK